MDWLNPQSQRRRTNAFGQPSTQGAAPSVGGWDATESHRRWQRGDDQMTGYGDMRPRQPRRAANDPYMGGQGYGQAAPAQSIMHAAPGSWADGVAGGQGQTELNPIPYTPEPGQPLQGAGGSGWNNPLWPEPVIPQFAQIHNFNPVAPLPGTLSAGYTPQYAQIHNFNPVAPLPGTEPSGYQYQPYQGGQPLSGLTGGPLGRR